MRPSAAMFSSTPVLTMPASARPSITSYAALSCGMPVKRNDFTSSFLISTPASRIVERAMRYPPRDSSLTATIDLSRRSPSELISCRPERVNITLP